MKSLIVLALVATLAFAAFSASAAERECRPSLSNMYHCPDKSAPASKSTETSQPTSPGTPDLRQPVHFRNWREVSLRQRDGRLGQ